MKSTYKIALLILCTLIFGSGALYSYQQAQAAEAIEEAYIEKVARMIKDPQNMWWMKFELPEHPKRIEWNAEYTMPRVMFFAQHRGGSDKGNALWSMNLNATDVRLMIASDEVPGMLPNPNKLLKVSPNGRYLFVNGSPSTFASHCYFYDLKEHKATFLNNSGCYATHWLEGNDAILINQGTISRFLLANKHIAGVGSNGLDKGGRFDMNEDNSQIMSAWTEDMGDYYTNIEPNKNYGKAGDTLFYDVNSIELLERKDYFPQGCNYKTYSADGHYFVCEGTKVHNKSGKGVTYDVFKSPPPFNKIAKSPKKKIIQLNTFYVYGSAGNFILQREADKKSPVTNIKYWYHFYNGRLTSKGTPSTNIFSEMTFYISANLLTGYDQRDFTQFMPPLPTHAQMTLAKKRLQGTH